MSEGFNSAHNVAWRKCEALMNQKQHVEVVITKQSNQAKQEYRTHLTATVDCVRLLLQQGLAFRRHDESYDSSNQGNFLELLYSLATHNEIVNKRVYVMNDNNEMVRSLCEGENVMPQGNVETVAWDDQLNEGQATRESVREILHTTLTDFVIY
ncbi:hypothetical protein V6N13_065784 [Hibiscus sabdariffa]